MLSSLQAKRINSTVFLMQMCKNKVELAEEDLIIFDDNKGIILSNLHKNLCCGCWARQL